MGEKTPGKLPGDPPSSLRPDDEVEFPVSKPWITWVMLGGVAMLLLGVFVLPNVGWTNSKDPGANHASVPRPVAADTATPTPAPLTPEQLWAKDCLDKPSPTFFANVPRAEKESDKAFGPPLIPPALQGKTSLPSDANTRLQLNREATQAFLNRNCRDDVLRDASVVGLGSQISPSTMDRLEKLANVRSSRNWDRAYLYYGRPPAELTHTFLMEPNRPNGRPVLKSVRYTHTEPTWFLRVPRADGSEDWIRLPCGGQFLMARTAIPGFVPAA